MAHAAWKWMAVAAALGSGVFAACSENGGGGPNEDDPDSGVVVPGEGENVFRPGLGDDEGTPQGTPLSLPEGVRVTGKIIGVDASEGECQGASIPPAGSGGAVWACMKLENTSGAPVQVTLPPGMMITSDTGEGQNGLLVENVYFTVPPTLNTGGIDAGTDAGTGGPTYFVVPLHLYCLNESKSPSFDRMEYSLGNVTNDPALRELLSLLAGKTIDTEEEGEAVQGAIYSITEGKGLTSDDREALARIR
jgi:hypothetical protein